jgi:hypothetical protein
LFQILEDAGTDDNIQNKLVRYRQILYDKEQIRKQEQVVKYQKQVEEIRREKRAARLAERERLLQLEKERIEQHEKQVKELARRNADEVDRFVQSLMADEYEDKLADCRNITADDLGDVPLADTSQKTETQDSMIAPIAVFEQPDQARMPWVVSPPREPVMSPRPMDYYRAGSPFPELQTLEYQPSQYSELTDMCLSEFSIPIVPMGDVPDYDGLDQTNGLEQSFTSGLEQNGADQKQAPVSPTLAQMTITYTSTDPNLSLQERVTHQMAESERAKAIWQTLLMQSNIQSSLV